jgi:hypothetical protein
MRPLSYKDPHYRHHPKVYSRTLEIKLTAGTFEFPLPEDNYIADKQIIGFSVARQSAAGDRKTKTGRLLAADAAFNSCFITFKHGNNDVLDSYRLENAVVDTKLSGIPGQYDQLTFPPGVKPSSCKINFPAGTTIVTDTAIEITLHFDFDDAC